MTHAFVIPHPGRFAAAPHHVDHAAQGPGQACPRVSGGAEKKASFVLDPKTALSDCRQKSGYL